MKTSIADNLVVVRSGGDIATGVIQKLWRAGLYVAVLENAEPLTIRRGVALSSAVRLGRFSVEDMSAVLVSDAAACREAWDLGAIPVLIDPTMKSLATLRPAVLVDAIIAKRNMGMRPGLAPVSIALGPGFRAPDDVDCVVETMRGHFLGRLITKGEALPNTGIPGTLGGKSAERVIYSPKAGVVRHARALGDVVDKDEIIFSVDGEPVRSSLRGVLRGLVAEGTRVPKGLKCADVDPREAAEVDWLTISDKARALGGTVLEACFMLAGAKGLTLKPNRKRPTLKAKAPDICCEKEPYAYRRREASRPGASIT